jgi:hypothetical protein
MSCASKQEPASANRIVNIYIQEGIKHVHCSLLQVLGIMEVCVSFVSLTLHCFLTNKMIFYIEEKQRSPEEKKKVGI